jgi:hypothetical protein
VRVAGVNPLDPRRSGVHYRAVLELLRQVSEVYARLGFLTKASIVLGIAVLGTVIAGLVVICLPSDHFCARHAPKRHPVAHAALVFGKNLLGVIILPFGIFMTLPFVPGPGLVFILIGLSLIDFPGKRALERKLLDRPAVLRFINGLRARFGRPLLAFEADARPAAGRPIERGASPRAGAPADARPGRIDS